MASACPISVTVRQGSALVRSASKIAGRNAQLSSWIEMGSGRLRVGVAALGADPDEPVGRQAFALRPTGRLLRDDNIQLTGAIAAINWGESGRRA